MDRIALLKEILEQRPDDLLARYGLAMEYAKTGQTDTALAEFRKIIAANPDYTAAYQMAGQMLAGRGRTDEARQWLQQGLACAQRIGNQHAQSEMQGMLDELGPSA